MTVMHVVLAFLILAGVLSWDRANRLQKRVLEIEGRAKGVAASPADLLDRPNKAEDLLDRLNKAEDLLDRLNKAIDESRDQLENFHSSQTLADANALKRIEAFEIRANSTDLRRLWHLVGTHQTAIDKLRDILARDYKADVEAGVFEHLAVLARDRANQLAGKKEL